MPDTLEVSQEPVTMTEVKFGDNQKDPFADWSETPPSTTTPQTQSSPATPSTDSNTSPTQPSSATPQSEEETFDEETYLKTNFGWENAESAKAEIERLRNLEKNPPREEVKFSNDESKRIFDHIKAGQTKPVRDYLDQQDRLDRLTQYDLSKADQAADILKAHLQFKNPDLTSREVDRLISRKFSFPEKPTNSLDLTPEENQAALQSWQQKVQEIEEDMIIEAKLVRPELAQYKSQLSLPDIEYVDPKVAEAQQKELQDWQTNRNNYINALDSELKNFNGFSVKYKDNDVEYAVPYGVTPEELTTLKTELSDFNRDKFFDERWFDQNGKPRISQIAADIYLLKNGDKILQKMVSESANQLLVHVKKQRANITVGTTSQGTFQPNNLSEQEKQEAAIWSA